MKKVLYWLPAAVALLFYGVLALHSQSLNLLVCLILTLLITAAWLLSTGKWWGCVPGIMTGCILIGMGLQETGQIIKEWPIGLFLCIFFLILGCITCAGRKKLVLH